MAATDLSRSANTGLLIQDHRLTSKAYSADLSTVTQAGPLPGVPEAQGDTEMVLEATGSQNAGTRYEILGRRGGMPLPDRGSFVWRDDAADDWRGWDPPVAITAYEALDANTTANRWEHPHAVTLSDGTVVAVALKARQYVQAWTRSTTGGTWSNVQVYDAGGTVTNSLRPCLVVLPNDRILCFFWVEDTAANTNQIAMYYSDDAGATWTLGQSACLLTALDLTTVTPGRLRAAFLAEQVLLVAGITDSTLTYQDVLVQYASADRGSTFAEVDRWVGNSEETHGAYHDLLVVNGQFQLYYLRECSTTTANIVPFVKTVGNAFSLLSVATAVLACDTANPMEWGDTALHDLTNGDLAVWLDDDGVLYMTGRNHDAGQFMECYVQRSIDGGTTWTTMGFGGAAGGAIGASWWHGRDASVYPRDFCGVAQGARAILLHEIESDSATTLDDSLVATFLGGFTTVCLPAKNRAIVASERVAFERTWLPFELPDVLGGIYTSVTGGTPTVILGADGLRLQGGAGDSQSYNLTTKPTSTLLQGLITLIDMKVAGGSGFIQVRIANGTPVSYTVRVTVTPTSITLRDMEGSVDIGSATVTTAGATGVQILIALGQDAGTGNSGNVKAWFRPATTGTGTDREWQPCGSLGTSAGLDAGSTADNDIQWGILNGVGTDATFKIHQYTYGEYTGQQLCYGQDNPDELLGRNFSTTGGYVDGGLKLVAKDGPVFANDLWYISTRYTYPIENIFPDYSPSPDTVWRSTSDASELTIALAFDEDAGEENSFRGPMFGVHLNNINFRTAYVEGYDVDTSSWVAIGTIDASTSSAAHKYVREGQLVRPDTGTTTAADPFYTENILAGSSFRLASGKVRKIVTNTGGAWNNATTLRTRITLDGALNTDPTSGMAGDVWSRDVTLLVNNATTYSRVRLRIPAQDTADGFFQIGAMVNGHVAVFGFNYSWGRAFTVAPNTELTTARSGRRRSRRLGATRRAYRLGWREPADTTEISLLKPVPSYVLPYTGATDAVGAPAATPYLLSGLLAEFDGPDKTVVYLGRVDKQANASAAILITNRHLQLYGRVVSETIEQTVQMGDEWSNEMWVGAEMTIEEEV
jgi:hypothetical protein